MDVHFDMETQDPDDVFTLCVLATHPRINLRGVTLFPGGRDQVGLVKHILHRLGVDSVPIGADPPNDEKGRVSEFHYKWLGKVESKDPDTTAKDVIRHNLDATLLTGAPLRNIGRAFEPGEKFFTDWTCQGGFAGFNLVAKPLPKFLGNLTCPTFNLNGDPKAAELLLGDPRLETNPKFEQIRMVSKNVCHGVIFNPQQALDIPRGAHPGLDLLLDGMQFYFRNSNPQGKALHDTIAAALTLDPEAATWVWGTPYRKKGEWGFWDADNTNCRITIGLDVERMYQAWIG